jgi:hypothetical protein
LRIEALSALTGTDICLLDELTQLSETEPARWESAGYNIHEPTTLAIPKFHDTITSGEKGVIFPSSYIATRVKLGSSLADDNAASADDLTCKHFHPKPLGVGIAAVPS